MLLFADHVQARLIGEIRQWQIEVESAALTGLAINLGEDMPVRQAVLEALIVLAVFWTAALLLRP